MISSHEYQFGDLVIGPAGRGEVVSVTTLFAAVRWEDGREEEVDQFAPGIVVDVRGFDRPGVWHECVVCGAMELVCEADPDDWEYLPDGEICAGCLEDER